MALIVAGGTGSGKSTLGQNLAAKLGWPITEVGAIVRQLFSAQCTSPSLIDFANAQLSNDPCFFIRIAVGMSLSPRHLLIGIRTVQELRLVRKITIRPFLVYLDVPSEVRARRRLGESPAAEEVEAFVYRDQIEHRWGLAELGRCAELRLENAYSPEALTASILASSAFQKWHSHGA